LVWPVPPLSIQKRGDAGEAGASDAARLFADRAGYVQPGFELNEDVAGAVETIVRRVDGIPLAIELAAARVRVLSAAEIADGLDDHLRLLRGGHQSDPRHQTISQRGLRCRPRLAAGQNVLSEPSRTAARSHLLPAPRADIACQAPRSANYG